MSDTTPAEIGHGLTVALRRAEGLPGFMDGTVVGVLLTHPCSARGGAVVQDFIPVEPYPHHGGAWVLVQAEPVSLAPSVSYTCCGTHGFVQAGRWVPV